MKFSLLVLSFLFSIVSFGQSFITRDIKSFGAKGDGKTNDQVAFEKAAAFFNARKGNGKLVISKGNYVVGKQTFTAGKNGKPAYEGANVLFFTGVQNLTVQGTTGTKLKYINGLKYGAFNPETGKPDEHGGGYFVNWAYAATGGHCILIDNSTNVTISTMELDGNSGTMVLGGSYGDVGRQLPHYGIFIQNSHNVTVEKVNLHHFGLDGICVANIKSDKKDNIKLLDSRFEYNSRQGFSWIGGNDLLVKNCKFNHTGQGKFNSAPGAGVDIEAEYGPIRNGVFENCEFINNKGCALVADSGDSGNCTFKNSTFWGVENWSIWVTKPAYTFIGCNIYGSIVHGYNSPTDADATKYISCRFEDKPYKGRDVFGTFLIESNGMRRVSFTNCTMVSNKKKLFWLYMPANYQPEEKYRFNGCHFISKASFSPGDYGAIFRGVRYKNTWFEFTNPVARRNGNGLNDCCEAFNVDLGGNKTTWVE